MTRDEAALFALHYGEVTVAAALGPYAAGWLPAWTWLVLVAACLGLAALACAKAAAT